MAIHLVREGQNLFDLAVQLYGDAQFILQLCEDNDLLLTSDISGNDRITYDDTILRQTNTTLYLALNAVDIVSADLDQRPDDMVDHNAADYTSADHN